MEAVQAQGLRRAVAREIHDVERVVEVLEGHEPREPRPVLQGLVEGAERGGAQVVGPGAGEEQRPEVGVPDRRVRSHAVLGIGDFHLEHAAGAGEQVQLVQFLPEPRRRPGVELQRAQQDRRRIGEGAVQGRDEPAAGERVHRVGREALAGAHAVDEHEPVAGRELVLEGLRQRHHAPLVLVEEVRAGEGRAREAGAGVVHHRSQRLQLREAVRGLQAGPVQLDQGAVEGASRAADVGHGQSAEPGLEALAGPVAERRGPLVAGRHRESQWS